MLLRRCSLVVLGCFPLLQSTGSWSWKRKTYVTACRWLVPGGYIPTLETKQRECWKFWDSRCEFRVWIASQCATFQHLSAHFQNFFNDIPFAMVSRGQLCLFINLNSGWPRTIASLTFPEMQWWFVHWLSNTLCHRSTISFTCDRWLESQWVHKPRNHCNASRRFSCHVFGKTSVAKRCEGVRWLVLGS